jgi:hypothetical protein
LNRALIHTLCLVVMDQLQVFRECVRVEPILVFLITGTVAQQRFINAHQIGRASVDRVDNGRFGPGHPAIVRRSRVGRVLDAFFAPSRFACLTYLEADSVGDKDQAICQINI